MNVIPNARNQTTVQSRKPSEALKTRVELAAELNICTKTMRKFLKNAGVELPKGLLQVPHQLLIRGIVLGVPNNSQKFPTIPNGSIQ
jgi:hypothetical protein